jgi:hypothetical protein
MIELYNLNDMTSGWFIGNFEPTICKTNTVEVAIKRYSKSQFENEHFHKIATEYTVIIEGIAEINEKKYYKDDIIVIKPNISVKFKAITDLVTLVVKLPGANDDKYFK